MIYIVWSSELEDIKILDRNGYKYISRTNRMSIAYYVEGRVKEAQHKDCDGGQWLMPADAPDTYAIKS